MDKSHWRCRQSNSDVSFGDNAETTLLLTRLIDVSSNVPVLMETRGQHGSYVVLSYHWGKGLNNHRSVYKYHKLLTECRFTRLDPNCITEPLEPPKHRQRPEDCEDCNTLTGYHGVYPVSQMSPRENPNSGFVGPSNRPMVIFGPPKGSIIGWGSFEEGGGYDEDVERGPLYCFNVSPNQFYNHETE